MNSGYRPIGDLYNRAYAEWQRVCLGSTGRLGCSPAGIAFGLVVMVGAGLISSRYGIETAIQVALRVVLAVAAVSIIVLAAFLARTLRPAPLTPVTDRRAAPQPRPAPRPEQVPDHVPAPGEAVALSEKYITVVLHPDGVERIEEPESIGEPV